jgi:peroxiredoxin family protein
MPETPAVAVRERISLIVFSGDFERVHYALATAAAAAAIGKPSTLLFTGPAIAALLAPGPERASGWCALPGRNGRCGGEVDADYRARGVAGFEELLAACVEMGVRLIVCEMGLRVEGLDRAALRADLPLESAGLATLLADASASGALTFI